MITHQSRDRIRILAWCGIVAVFLSWMGPKAQAQDLVHQYSFASDVHDSVGGADGALIGNATLTSGAAVLDGSVHDYVDLPNDLVLSLTSASIETWVTWDGGPVWQRIFDF